MNTRKTETGRGRLSERFEMERSSRCAIQAAITGTFDVSNFGDLLFPLIAEFELGKRLKGVELTRYSYRQLDEKHWPYAVNSLARLPQKIPTLNLLLVGGGHLVRFDKLVAPGYEPTDADLHHPTAYWLMPTLLALASGVPVAWNCVGVSPNTPSWARRFLALALENSPYISVRDEFSARELQEISTQAKIRIVPDTAFGIHALLPRQPSASFRSFCSKIGLGRPYIIVQASRQLQQLAPLVKAAVLEARAQGCEILELPISPVLGDSVGVLDLDGKTLQVKIWPEPLLIAELVANAEAAIAQSLHLTIVALACGVPVHRPRCGEASKYGHIENIEGVHLWDPGVDAATEIRNGLGKREPGVRMQEMQAQLATHWDEVAELASRRVEPRPEITSAIVNHCIQVAEENSLESSGKQNGISSTAHQSSPHQANGAAEANGVAELKTRYQECVGKTDAVSCENARLQVQLDQQAEQLRALQVRTHTLDSRMQEIATEAHDQLQRQEAYYALIARVRGIVRETLPAHSTVLVVSNGDDQLTSFAAHSGWHFPRTESGLYAGRHPANSAEAIAELDKQRFKGAQYVLFPETSFWWFNSYPELASHLETHYRVVLNREDTCRIYSLRERS